MLITFHTCLSSYLGTKFYIPLTKHVVKFLAKFSTREVGTSILGINVGCRNIWSWYSNNKVFPSVIHSIICPYLPPKERAAEVPSSENILSQLGWMHFWTPFFQPQLTDTKWGNQIVSPRFLEFEHSNPSLSLCLNWRDIWGYNVYRDRKYFQGGVERLGLESI